MSNAALTIEFFINVYLCFVCSNCYFARYRKNNEGTRPCVKAVCLGTFPYGSLFYPERPSSSKLLVYCVTIHGTSDKLLLVQSILQTRIQLFVTSAVYVKDYLNYYFPRSVHRQFKRLLLIRYSLPYFLIPHTSV